MASVAYVEDVGLVDRCLEGEEAAARELFRKHRQRVHACLYRVLGASRDMDDLLQDVFIQVFQSLKGWRAEASLATWIDRIAVRVAWRYLSQRKATPPMLELVEEAVTLGAASVASAAVGARRQQARDGVRRLYAALDRLPPAARLAFALHEIEGRSMAEVATLTGATVTATKLRVWRARRALTSAAAADPVLREMLEERDP